MRRALPVPHPHPLLLTLALALPACSGGDPVAAADREAPLLLSISGDRARAVPVLRSPERTAWPLHTRSPRVPVVHLEGQRIAGRVDGGRDVSLRAAFVPHGEAERLLFDDDAVWIAGAPVLPPDLSGVDASLIARRDGVSVASGRLEFDVPEGVDHAVVQGPGPRLHDGSGTLTLGPAVTGLGTGHADGRCIPVTPGERAWIELEGAPVDQLFLASVRPAPALEWAEVALDTEGNWTLEAPAVPEEGRSWTLVTELRATLDVIEAAAPRLTGWWRDVTASSGVTFVHFEGPDLQLDIRPTMGPGAAWGDVDGDGWPDLYLVQGSGRAGVRAPNRLYRNLAGEGFQDVTGTAGVGDTGAGMGALFFDADGDGDLDLYVANYGADVLYRNDGAGTFTDVTADAGLDAGLWSASVTAADADGDGDLDLYVTRYLDFDPSKMPPESELAGSRRDDPFEMLPFAFPGQPNLFLRNESTPEGLRFVDATQELGLEDPRGLGMQSVWWDFDHDDDQDLYVANDVTPNTLFENLGDGTFTNVTFAVGLDDPRGGMGLAVGDVENDGDEDVFLTNWELETNALYLNQFRRSGLEGRRQARFRDRTVAAGLGAPSIGVTSWAGVLFDTELDGDLDLFIANGYTSPDYRTTGVCVGQPNQLFRNEGEGRFVDARAEAGGALNLALASRGVAPCDWDRDGDVDLVVTSNNGPVQLLENRTPPLGRWIAIALDGPPGNPFGVGAVVTIHDGERSWRRTLRAGEGYLTAGAPELHFGLGRSARRVRASVRWPDGTQTDHHLLETYGLHRLAYDG